MSRSGVSLQIQERRHVSNRAGSNAAKCGTWQWIVVLLMLVLSAGIGYASVIVGRTSVCNARSTKTLYYHLTEQHRYGYDTLNALKQPLSGVSTRPLRQSMNANTAVNPNAFVIFRDDYNYETGTNYTTHHETMSITENDDYLESVHLYIRPPNPVDLPHFGVTLENTTFAITTASGTFTGAVRVVLEPRNDVMPHRPRAVHVQYCDQ